MAAAAPVAVSAASDPFACEYHTRRLEVAAELRVEYPSLTFPRLGRHALALHTTLRATETNTAGFVAAADQLLRQLVECALDTLPVIPRSVATPTGAQEFPGCVL